MLGNKTIFVIIALVGFLVSCNKGAKSVLEKAEQATFIIYTFDEHGSPAGCGSGFFIDKDGIGITNYHVLDKSMKAVIRLKNGKEYEIDKVLASDKKWDIVKFSILNDKKKKFSYLEFSNMDVEPNFCRWTCIVYSYRFSWPGCSSNNTDFPR